MNRLDRCLGILLALRGQATASAPLLARRFEVSVRTIYRDIEALAELGIPVYAEPGRHGGFRLLDGHFMPPVSFSFGEAMALVLAQAFQQGLRVRPFPAAAESAGRKLLAAMPEPVRSRLAAHEKLLGVERLPGDLLHPERADPQTERTDPAARDLEAGILGEFAAAIVRNQAVQLDYHGPYADQSRRHLLDPLALLWDRDRWYLIAAPRERTTDSPLSLRADRALALQPAGLTRRPQAAEFDVRVLLERRWLGTAMRRWAEGSPVCLRLSARAFERLRQDWFYRHALFEPLADGQVLMRWGEDRMATVFELLGWLGAEAELLEPVAWRESYRAQLQAMLERY